MAHTLSAAGDTGPAPRTRARSSPPTGTVTFLFTDIEGSTALWERQREAMQAALAQHHAILRTAIEANDGHVFNIAGDAFCAAFATAPAALAAALGAQRALQSTFNNQEPIVPQQTGSIIIRVRMGLHTGGAEAADGDYRSGPTLNRVARVMALAHGGQILVSQTTADLVRNEATGVTLRDMGLHRLKGLADPERILQVVAPDLPSEFPPLALATTIPNNLPVQLTSFVGREKEIAEVKRLLAGSRLVTLTGSGGTGKTRLSLAVAADVLEEFPDGVWLAELAPLADPAFVPQTVASVLGVHEQPGRPIIETLREHLHDKQALIVLDNCEHLIDACAQLADSLLHAAPHLKLLASSREALGIAGEHTYPVPSLSAPDAEHVRSAAQLTAYDSVRLFVDRASAVHPHFKLTDANAPAVAQICRRLDGIPLAIELAAARARALRVEQIVERLDDRFRLLTGGSRTALPRQQTLRALIDWSYGLLSEQERTLLRRLSVFAGGWTLEAAEEVASDKGQGASEFASDAADLSLATSDVLDLLTRLVDKSLVVSDEQASEPRYRMLETIRQYAREKLLESGEGEQIRGRHLRFFTRFANAGHLKVTGREQVAWLARFDSEQDNLRTALEWSLQAGDPLARLQLPASMMYFWSILGVVSEGIEALTAALTPSGESSLTPQLASARVRALIALSSLLFQVRPTEARHVAEEAVTLATRFSNDAAVGPALTVLGMSALYQGDYATARECATQGLAAVRAADDQPYVAFALRVLGDEAYLQSDYDRALPFFAESAATHAAMGDTNYRAYELRRMGFIALYQKDLDKAQALMRESLSSNLLVKEKQGTIGALVGLAAISEARGQSTRAATLFGATVTLLEAMHTTLLVPDAKDREYSLGLTRAHLGPAAFDTSFAEGRALTLEQAVALALKETDG